jgi:hypothetical protein
MKAALCFIISYEHILNKEEIWREWIEPNKDIINIYFYYKDFKKIKSSWILQHTIPQTYIYETSYYHVIPAYLSIMKFAAIHDINNTWFCMLTDSCCPIISPKRFRYLFFNYYQNSIMNWKKPWWNIDYHKRANLNKLPNELHLANDPWFILKKENLMQILNFVNVKQDLTNLICNGGLANESLFAIILYLCKQLGKTKNSVISGVTHITDWSRMVTATSPHLFKEGNDRDINFINSELEKNKYTIFIRKIDVDFPNDILRNYIFNYNKEKDEKLIIKTPFRFIFNKCIRILYDISPYLLIIFLFIFYYFVFF